MILTKRSEVGLKIRTEFRKKIKYFKIVPDEINLFLIIDSQVFTVSGREVRTLVLTSLFYLHQRR